MLGLAEAAASVPASGADGAVSLGLGVKKTGGIDVTDASVMVEMPGLNWPMFGDLFTIERIAGRSALLLVPDPSTEES